jgi:Do/DeqQ family serine protease
MKSFFKYAAVAFGAAFLTLVGYHLTQKQTVVYTPVQPQTVATNFTPTTPIKAIATDFTAAAEKTIDAVVHITNTSIEKGQRPSSFMEYFYGRSTREYPRIGMGSGVIVSSDGYIITNNHVVEGATTLEITTNDNKKYEVEVIGSDSNADIAVLKIKGDYTFPYVRFADSDNTRIGEWVLAVGNPYNLNSTVTAGIISAKSRDFSDYDNKNQSFIQTDAAVNSGNSGGALVNLDGDLIGINTAITSNGMGTFIGYSFAVPSNIARKIFEDIIEYGNVQKALLGVTGNGLNAHMAEQLGIEKTEGFYVGGLEANMGAIEAGILEGDIITKIDNAPIRKFADLTGYLGSKRPGESVDVTVVREGKTLTLAVELKATPFVNYYGMRLRNLSEKEADLYDTSTGVYVSGIENSRLFHRGVQTGDVLLAVNGKEVNSKSDVLALDEESIYELTFLNKNGEKMRFIFE